MAQHEHWRLDKTLNIGHLFTTIAAIGLLFVWVMDMDSRFAAHDIRIANNATEISHTEQRMNKSFDRLEERMDKSFNRVHDLLSKMNDKLDKINEHRPTK